MSKQEREKWTSRTTGALSTAPVMGFIYYLIDNFRHKDCISVEEHRIQVEQWIEALNLCQQFYSKL